MHEHYDMVSLKRSSHAGAATRRVLPMVVTFASIACLIPPALLFVGAQSPSTEAAVRQVLTAQQDAWNAGDLDAFMSGYESSAATTFVGTSVTRGYRQVLENYRHRYSTKEKMGRLAFSAIEVTPLGAEFASVIGKFHLDRPAEAGGTANGIFTLVFRKTASGWKIILDHTS